MPTTFKRITPSVSALLAGDMMSDLRVHTPAYENCRTATLACTKVLRAYRIGQRQPLTDKQREKLRRRLLYTGGSLYIAIDHLEDMHARKLLRRANRMLEEIANLLDVTVQHLQQEAARIDEILAKKLSS